MQGKNPPAEPGPAGGLRFGAQDGTETLEISGRSRDLLYLCVITRSARRRAPAGAGCAMARPGGSLAHPPSLPSLPGSWETLRLLIHAGGSWRGGRWRFLRLYPPPCRGWETHGRRDGAALGNRGRTRGEQSSREGYGERREDGSRVLFPKFFFLTVPRRVFSG